MEFIKGWDREIPLSLKNGWEPLDITDSNIDLMIKDSDGKQVYSDSLNEHIDSSKGVTIFEIPSQIWEELDVWEYNVYVKIDKWGKKKIYKLPTSIKISW